MILTRLQFLHLDFPATSLQDNGFQISFDARNAGVVDNCEFKLLCLSCMAKKNN